MKPTWQTTDGSVKLYLGDCGDVLSALPTSSVDVVITSPPYNLGTTTGGGVQLGHYTDGVGYRGGGSRWQRAAREGGISNGYDETGDDMPHAEYVAWQQAIVAECWDLIAADGAIYYNHKPRVLGGVLVPPTDYLPERATVRQIVIWARAGGFNYSEAFYVPTHEWIIVCAKRDFRLKSKGASGVGDVWRIPQERDDEHPASFPLALPSRVIETTDRKIYADPFMGAGTTGVAAVRAGKKFLGIEKSPKYFDTAVKRIEAELNRAPLFDAPPAIQSGLF